jgi:hypothetical protein
LHDLSSPSPEGAGLHMDRGYESHLCEDLLREAQGIVPMVIRRYVPWLQYLAIVGRRVVETAGGMLHAMFPRRIHAVTQEGFAIKVLSFVLAHNLKLLTQEMA